MEPNEGGLTRLKGLAGAASKRVVETSTAAARRAGEVADDVQGAAKRAAGDAAEFAGTAGRKVAVATKEATQHAVEVVDDVQEAAKRTADQALMKAAEARSAVASLVVAKQGEGIDLSILSDEVKLLYCRTLLRLALVDGVLDPREISNLYLFASTIGLGSEARSALRQEITGVHRPSADGETDGNAAGDVAADLCGAVEEDQREALITMLVRDLVRISRADQDASASERAQIVVVARLAFPDSADKVVEATEHLVVTEEEFAAGKLTTGQLEARTKDIIAKAAAFGVPLATVSVAGSVSGLGAAGITSGLAALGFGGLLGLSAMVTGIGVVVILGVVVHQGVRWVLAVNEREREHRREALIQQIIANHQQAMAELTDDIAALAGRMESYLSQTTRNEERLSALRSELAAFQRALVDLQASQDAFERREPVSAG